MGILNTKVQASTLVEVIVALLIILSSFALALMVIDSNRKSANTRQLIKAHQSVLKQKNKCFKEKRFFNEETDFNQIHIVQTIEDNPLSKELKLLTVEAFDSTKTLLVSEKELIIAE